MAVYLAHIFRGQFTGGVWTNRLQIEIIFRPGHPWIVPIHTAGRGKHKFTDAVDPGKFKQVKGPHHIGLVIIVRIFNARSHTCFCRQVENGIESDFSEPICQLSGLRGSDIQFMKMEGGLFTAPLQVQEFRNGVIKRIEIIDTMHLMAVFQQRFSQITSNESGSAGQQYGHVGLKG